MARDLFGSAFAWAVGPVLLFAAAGAAAQDGTPQPPAELASRLSATIAYSLDAVAVILVLLLVVLICLVWRSQSIYGKLTAEKYRLFELALKEHNPGLIESGALESDAPPLAVPAGTVRAVLAVTIVLISLSFVVIYLGGRMSGFPDLAMPEIIATVLGTVLGFYFGTRGTSETKEVLRQATQHAQESERTSREVTDRTLSATLDRLTQAQPQAAGAGRPEAPADPSVLETVRSNARGLLTAAQAISALLPEGQGKRLKQTVTTASTALDLVDGLLGKGKRGEAFEEARRARSQTEQSLTGLVQDAIDGVAPVVGGLVPGGALVLGLIRLGAGLSGQAYERWRNEILSAPHSPELFPPTAVSVDVAMPLMRKVDTLATLFAEELAQGNRAALNEFKDLALSEGGPALAAERFKDRNTEISAGEIEAGVEAFRSLVRQDLLFREIPEDTMPRGEVAGIVGAVDRMAREEEENPTAAAGLAQVHKMVLVIDKLNELGLTSQLLELAGRAVGHSSSKEAA